MVDSEGGHTQLPLAIIGHCSSRSPSAGPSSIEIDRRRLWSPPRGRWWSNMTLPLSLSFAFFDIWIWRPARNALQNANAIILWCLKTHAPATIATGPTGQLVQVQRQTGNRWLSKKHLPLIDFYVNFILIIINPILHMFFYSLFSLSDSQVRIA